MALDLAAPHPDESIVDQQDKRRAAVSWYRFFLLIASTLNSLSRTLTSTVSDLAAVAVLTTRGDLVTRGATANVRLPIGAAGTLLSSDGTDASWQAPAAANIAMQLLTSGNASGASLDIPLGSYTSYRAIIVKLYGFLPVTDGVDLQCKFSTDNGANWIGSGYRHAVGGALDTPGYIASTGSTSDSKIVLSDTTGNAQIGNGADEGINITVEIMGWQLTAFKPRIHWDAVYMTNAATTAMLRIFGGGENGTPQDCTGLQFLFSSGNIASGKYAVYGLT